MDLSIFDAILALRDELVASAAPFETATPAVTAATAGKTRRLLKTAGAGPPQDQAAAALVTRAGKERERVLRLLALAKPRSAARIREIRTAAAAPLATLGPLPSPPLKGRKKSR